MSDTKILCDTSTGVPRPFDPLKFRCTMFDSLHSLSHPVIGATQYHITAWFVWPGINADVRMWARTCHVNVQMYNDTLLLHSPPHLQILILDLTRSIDLLGSLPPLNGYTYLPL